VKRISNYRLILTTIPTLLILLAMGVLIHTASAAMNERGNLEELLDLNAPGGFACPVGMVAYWELEESDGPYLDSYNGHDGDDTGTPPTQVPGKFGKAQDFASTTTGIDVPSDEDFDWEASDSFSIEFWVKADVDACLTHSRVVVGRDDGAGVQWWVGCAAVSGQATFQLDDSDNVRKTLKGVSITDGAWHHIVAIRDGAADMIYLYVDNVKNEITANTYTGDFTAVAPANVNIGWINHRIDSPDIHRFLGVIDEVAIYSRVLSAEQVSLHFQGGQDGMARSYCDIPTDVFLPIVLK
jgi:hypothetical protein